MRNLGGLDLPLPWEINENDPDITKTELGYKWVFKYGITWVGIFAIWFIVQAALFIIIGSFLEAVDPSGTFSRLLLAKVFKFSTFALPTIVTAWLFFRDRRESSLKKSSIKK